MWVIYANNLTPFEHLDKYTYALVEDSDILMYQKWLAGPVGTLHTVHTQAEYLQKFVTISGKVFHARKFSPWSNSQSSDNLHQSESCQPETLLAWKSRAEEPRPCNIE